MSTANDLIEKMEAETGQRIDDEGDNLAMAGLFGAISRLMGLSPSIYTERDDMAAGLLVLHQMSPEYEDKQRSNTILTNMLRVCLSPDEVKGFFG